MLSFCRQAHDLQIITVTGLHLLILTTALMLGFVIRRIGR